MPKPLFTPTPEQTIEVFRNSLVYEIMFTFGIPHHDPMDYCQWETVNFARIGHARVLYSFFQGTAANRKKDDVVSEDYGFPSRTISLPPGDEDRMNKDLLHLTYARLRHSPVSKSWPDSILSCLQPIVIDFMEHIQDRLELFPAPRERDAWISVLKILKSGHELLIRGTIQPDSGGCLPIGVGSGDLLPDGVAILTKWHS